MSKKSLLRRCSSRPSIPVSKLSALIVAMIEDWEIGALYWNVLKSKSEQEALEDVKKKYLGFVADTDLHLFLGTTKQHHYTARNPFMIIGCFPIPFETQAQFEF